MQHWNSKEHNPGFSHADFSKIMSLNDIDEASVDCVLRVCAPLYPPSKQARRTISFAITELGFDRTSLSNPDLQLDEITADSNLIVTSTRWSRDRLIDFGFREDKLRVVSCGVDFNTFSPLSDDELVGQRSALQIPTDAVVFLNVGVPTWNKGVDLLIRTFALVNNQYPNTRLFLKDARGLYGYPVDNVLKEIEQKYPGLLNQSIRSCISIIPNNLTQIQLRSLYGIADWYVSPYRAEGFNLPVLEAQSCGTPVITTSGGSTDDFCNTTAARKIASVFHRGRLRDGCESCWVEPHLQSLEALMLQSASEGPRPAWVHDALRKEARSNALRYSWDNATKTLMSFIQTTA
jgi:glycosyltransferase involved in cell wall biosynthesis